MSSFRVQYTKIQVEINGQNTSGGMKHIWYCKISNIHIIPWSFFFEAQIIFYSHFECVRSINDIKNNKTLVQAFLQELKKWQKIYYCFRTDREWETERESERRIKNKRRDRYRKKEKDRNRKAKEWENKQVDINIFRRRHWCVGDPFLAFLFKVTNSHMHTHSGRHNFISRKRRKKKHRKINNWPFDLPEWTFGKHIQKVYIATYNFCLA